MLQLQPDREASSVGLRNLIKELLVVVLGLAAALAVVLFPKWKAAAELHGQGRAEPFRIAGNLYFVGASDLGSSC